MPKIGDRHPNQDAINADALRRLADKFSKPDRKRDNGAKTSKSNNGWTK